ncbi:hypothetical protein [Aegicerativicinus sediminis]|uniref:hypothetical protein n=1 Tax=Aegicerativicinus sediminis TaxID=2893202 RepID=UPI001E657F1C|nr:hypothetical protein [Aegicerativicinus sediminis]
MAALLGLMLRYSQIFPISINYRYVTHAHSHIAMLGWAYLMLYALIVETYVSKKGVLYQRLFWMTQITVWGMLFSFPFQGYAAVSISFSTLHILCSYYFSFLVWKDFKGNQSSSSCFIKTALFFMILSTAGVWCLGPAVAISGKASDFYQTAIQFFLHFQFNGWFLFAVLGLLVNALKVKQSKRLKSIYFLWVTATFLTFSLPLQWFYPHWSLFWIHGVGTLFQIIGLLWFVQIIWSNAKNSIRHADLSRKSILLFSLSCIILKNIFQLASLHPTFATEIYQHRLYVIGFIHLLMLGGVSGFLLLFILMKNIFTQTSIFLLGLFCFLAGFLLTELLLLAQGYLYFSQSEPISNYALFMFSFSVFIPISIALFISNILGNKAV